MHRHLAFACIGDDLTTTNPDILAVGDVIDRADLRLTHMAGTMAGMAVENAVFGDGHVPVNAPSGRIAANQDLLLRTKTPFNFSPVACVD
eukprot:2541823-Amphidinium_carterae.1